MELVLFDHDHIDPIPKESMFITNDSVNSEIARNGNLGYQKRAYMPMFSVERELDLNLLEITNLKITSLFDYTHKTTLLLKRVELLKLQDLIGSIKALK